jgi:hypothetical protein
VAYPEVSVPDATLPHRPARAPHRPASAPDPTVTAREVELSAQITDDRFGRLCAQGGVTSGMLNSSSPWTCLGPEPSL